MPLPEDLGPLLRAYEDCWNRIKPTELRRLWDPAEREPFYVAEEIETPLTSWEAVERYWQNAEALLKQWAIRTWDLHCKPLPPDLAALQFMMHWNGTVKGNPVPMGLNVRVSALARRVDDGNAPHWRFTGHFVESPPGPLPYLRATYRANVDPDFIVES